MGDVVGLVVNLRTVDSDYDPGHGSRGTIRAHPHYARGTRGGHSGREGAVSEGGRGVNNMRFMVNLPWGEEFWLPSIPPRAHNSRHWSIDRVWVDRHPAYQEVAVAHQHNPIRDGLGVNRLGFLIIINTVPALRPAVSGTKTASEP